MGLKSSCILQCCSYCKKDLIQRPKEWELFINYFTRTACVEGVGHIEWQSKRKCTILFIVIIERQNRIICILLWQQEFIFFLHDKCVWFVWVHALEKLVPEYWNIKLGYGPSLQAIKTTVSPDKSKHLHPIHCNIKLLTSNVKNNYFHLR